MKQKALLFIFLTLMISLLISSVSADTGPKPSADITILYESQPLPGRFDAIMLECVDGEVSSDDVRSVQQRTPNSYDFSIAEYDAKSDCTWIPAYFAWGQCDYNTCTFGYHPPSEFKLVVHRTNTDELFTTNEISRDSFRSSYDAHLYANGSAYIVETTPILNNTMLMTFFKALLITLILELGVALLYIRKHSLSKKVLITVAVGSIITLPFVWFVFPLITIIPFMAAFIISEIFAFVVEAYFIHLVHKKDITLKKSFLLSLYMNLVSLFMGGFILALVIVIPTFF